MPKILGYSTHYDKLKEDFKLGYHMISELIECVPIEYILSRNILAEIHHTTIRLDKETGYYHAGLWQEVLKPRSKYRQVIRPLVEVLEPIPITLGELQDFPLLLEYDTMENGFGMTYAKFYALVEDFYGKTDYWKGEGTRLLILPICLVDEKQQQDSVSNFEDVGVMVD